MWDMREGRRHTVDRFDHTDTDSVVVGTVVTHDTDRLYIKQYGECLPYFVVIACSSELFLHNGIGFTQQSERLFVHLAHDTDSKSRSGEGVSADHVFG